MFGQSVFWRESMKPAKFLVFDGRVVLVLVPAFMHLRFWTLILAMFTMGLFWWFERKGIPADSIMRFLRSKLVGSKRTARGVFEERTAVDFGFESAGYIAREQREAMAAAGTQKVPFLARIGLAPKPQAVSEPQKEKTSVTEVKKSAALNLEKDDLDG
jgi:hypothetical protein